MNEETDWTRYKSLPADERDRLGFRMYQWKALIGAHGQGCYAWGPSHYQCAMQEIERLNRSLIAGQEASLAAKRDAATAEPSDENGGHRLVEPDHETALALADAPRSLQKYVAALQVENERLHKLHQGAYQRGFQAGSRGLREAYDAVQEVKRQDAWGNAHLTDALIAAEDRIAELEAQLSAAQQSARAH